jgi:hypothetical protein
VIPLDLLFQVGQENPVQYKTWHVLCMSHFMF